MIQVNLLPGSSARSQGVAGFNIGSALSSATAGIKDKFLLSAVGTVTATVLSIGFLYVGQSSLERSLVERETRAVEDSTRYRVVLAAKSNAEATRDSLYQQVAIIRSIDDSRYLWPHLLEEISNALPEYTWLTTITQTSAPPSSVASDSAREAVKLAAESDDKEKEREAIAKNARADSVLATASRSTKFRVVGHTVDIQALTLFMKTLEASPFIQNVQLARSDLVLFEGKEVTEFHLDAESQTAPPFLLRTVAISLGDN